MKQPKVLFSNILGTIIVNKETKEFYLYHKDKSINIFDYDLMEQIYKDHKHCNVLYKPYAVLIFGELYKNQKHGLEKPVELTNEEFEKMTEGAVRMEITYK